MKKTLLLVFIHGFKGSDTTFSNFPHDLQALLAHSLPKIDVLSMQYPQYETRGDLGKTITKFKDWLQNTVIDLEVANQTPSPTVDPSVHVILCGHSMGGIVAAETLLSITKEEPVLASQGAGILNGTATEHLSSAAHNTSAPTNQSQGLSQLFFPYIRGILSFDTPYLGISPGVLAHGAEQQINHASNAYQAFDKATQVFGWGPNNNTKATATAANASSGGGGWSRWAMYGGAAAAIAGAAGAAYFNRNSISEGFLWASSHLEFIGCLARGAEMQRRVESLINVTETHNLGFTNFYSALDNHVIPKARYVGSMSGEDRTFCVVPKDAQPAKSPSPQSPSTPVAASTRGVTSPPPSLEAPTSNPNADLPDAAAAAAAPPAQPTEEELRRQSERVQAFAKDPTKKKGEWLKCVNPVARDEITAHRSMFSPPVNPQYHAMLPAARDHVASWIDPVWYEDSQRVHAWQPLPEEGDGEGSDQFELD